MLYCRKQGDNHIWITIIYAATLQVSYTLTGSVTCEVNSCAVLLEQVATPWLETPKRIEAKRVSVNRLKTMYQMRIGLLPKRKSLFSQSFLKLKKNHLTLIWTRKWKDVITFLESDVFYKVILEGIFLRLSFLLNSINNIRKRENLHWYNSEVLAHKYGWYINILTGFPERKVAGYNWQADLVLSTLVPA